MKPRPQLVVVIAGAVFGLVFAGFSTYDFASHLDRQVHGVHCSFLPGLSTADATGASGCHATMMSTYSSVFRESVWGGIPISLPAMSVFAFLVFLAIEIVASGRQGDRRATGFLALAAALPAVTSLVMAVISLGVLGATCKLCIGIYVASAACFVGAILAWRAAGQDPSAEAGAEILAVAPTVRETPAQPDPGADPAWTTAPKEPSDPALASTLTGSPSPVASAPGHEPPSPYEMSTSGSRAHTSRGQLAMAFAIGVAFVLLPIAAYAALAPDHSRFIGQCGVLESTEDRYGVMVPLDHNPGGVPAIEVLDPLCPACRAFEDRLGSTDYAAQLNRRAVLFPLDKPCNWMIDEPEHPGACVVSQAVLCAGDRAPEVVAWSFSERRRIIAAETAKRGAAEQMVEARFPDLAECVGSAKAKANLNKSMRWSVQNHLQVLTPQLFIDGVKLCNEDVDIGLEYALSRMLERQRAGTLRPATAAPATETPAAEPIPVETTEPAAPPSAEPAAPEVAEPEHEPDPAVASQSADAGTQAPSLPTDEPAGDESPEAVQPVDAAAAPVTEPEPEPTTEPQAPDTPTTDQPGAVP